MKMIQRMALAAMLLAVAWVLPARAQDADIDGVLDADDLCANTPWSEMSITTVKPRNWAVIWGEFMMIGSNRKEPDVTYTLADTRGCSCTQIVDALKSAGGKGTNRLSSDGGCKDSVLEFWIASLAAGKGLFNLAEVRAAEQPIGIALDNYPNPFNPSTTIRFVTPEPSIVRVTVFNLLGTPVEVLVDGPVGEGSHEARFEADHLPSGIYLVRLDHPGGTITRPIQLMK